MGAEETQNKDSSSTIPNEYSMIHLTNCCQAAVHIRCLREYWKQKCLSRLELLLPSSQKENQGGSSINESRSAQVTSSTTSRKKNKRSPREIKHPWDTSIFYNNFCGGIPETMECPGSVNVGCGSLCGNSFRNNLLLSGGENASGKLWSAEQGVVPTKKGKKEESASPLRETFLSIITPELVEQTRKEIQEMENANRKLLFESSEDDEEKSSNARSPDDSPGSVAAANVDEGATGGGDERRGKVSPH